MPEDVAEAIVRAVPGRLAASRSTSLRPVINATGVIIHTNLGRAPLSAAAIERVAGIAGGYSNLEYDLASGERGKRDVHADRLVPLLTGAEGGVVVNNNAAATLITLAALAAGREVIVSRGELVEIGGGFRVPDVMSQSGAILREVGTTNRTRAADYAAATSEKTALILRVHPSNFRMEGFVERPRLAELVAIGRKLGVPVVEDQGSGYLGLVGVDVESPALRDEPSVRASIADGADLVMFSVDKLLGGPQAGIIAGRHALLTHIRRHPLMRALRADKMTYAALEATLQEYARGRASRSVPVARMLALTEADIDARAARIVENVAAKDLETFHRSGFVDDWRRERARFEPADAAAGRLTSHALGDGARGAVTRVGPADCRAHRTRSPGARSPYGPPGAGHDADASALSAQRVICAAPCRA